MRKSLVTLFILAITMVAAPVGAQTVIVPNQSLSLAWDAAGSVPPDEKYKIRLLEQATPSSVLITEVVTPDASTTFSMPWSVLPNQQFFVAVRALRVANSPGESGDSNIIGPFVKGTATLTPTNLRGVVVPTP